MATTSDMPHWWFKGARAINFDIPSKEDDEESRRPWYEYVADTLHVCQSAGNTVIHFANNGWMLSDPRSSLIVDKWKGRGSSAGFYLWLELARKEAGSSAIDDCFGCIEDRVLGFLREPKTKKWSDLDLTLGNQLNLTMPAFSLLKASGHLQTVLADSLSWTTTALHVLQTTITLKVSEAYKIGQPIHWGQLKKIKDLQTQAIAAGVELGEEIDRMCEEKAHIKQESGQGRKVPSRPPKHGRSNKPIVPVHGVHATASPEKQTRTSPPPIDIVRDFDAVIARAMTPQSPPLRTTSSKAATKPKRLAGRGEGKRTK